MCKLLPAAGMAESPPPLSRLLNSSHEYVGEKVSHYRLSQGVASPGIIRCSPGLTILGLSVDASDIRHNMNRPVRL